MTQTAQDQMLHWDQAYAERTSAQMSWTEESPRLSWELIKACKLDPEAALIDVGGGASRLSKELLHLGYSDLTVSDISLTALERAKSDLGGDAGRITWVTGDVRTVDFGRRFDLWHDRAVFHFMVEPRDRAAYVENLKRSLRVGGQLILATFGPDGPNECSGLPVRCYDAHTLASAVGPDFEPVSSRLHDHRTPSGAIQQFHYAHFERRGDDGP
ncbi:MAG: class I SAM-dependent methyltransferase [Solirubrobacterales bacterium]